MTGWHYLLLVNIYLLLFYGFYVLLLRKETFFHLNRVYLVAAALLSFFIPMIQSDWVKNLFLTREVQLTIYNSPLIIYQFKPIEHTQITIGQVLLVVYIAGIVLLTGRLIWQMIVLNKIINKPEATVAYSFFKKVKLGADHADNAIIAAHENVHANQWHSADVLLIEAVMIINWFNPVVYFYRFAIKHIHEYIADRQALRSGTTKSEYALLLLSQTFNTPAHQLVNPFFNHSLLKLRIMMLEKNKSRRIALVKYGLSAPLFIMMLILSSATISNSKTISIVNKKAEQVFLAPASAIPAAVLSDSIKAHNNASGSTDVINYTGKMEAPSSAVDTVPAKRNIVFTSVEKVPEFPGGLEAFSRYLGRNIRYPAVDRENGVQGRVIISFVVEKDGSLSDIHVTRGVAEAIDKEALRVMAASPTWKPGLQNGKRVRVLYSVPISFTLSDDSKQPDRNAKGAVKGKENSQDAPIATVTSYVSKADSGKIGFNERVSDPAHPPLYILDGKQVGDLTAVNVDNIERISVLKDKEALALYGPKGTNGAIVIITRKNLDLKPAPSKAPDTKH